MNPTFDQVVLYINAAVCAVTCLSVLMYERGGAAYSRWKSLVAYLVVVATGYIVLRTIFGLYHAPVDPSEFLLNLVVCAAMLVSRGNVSALFVPPPARGSAGGGR